MTFLFVLVANLKEMQIMKFIHVITNDLKLFQSKGKVEMFTNNIFTNI